MNQNLYYTSVILYFFNQANYFDNSFFVQQNIKKNFIRYYSLAPVVLKQLTNKYRKSQFGLIFKVMV